MSVKIDDKDITDVKIGDSQISSIYAGDVLIWESGYPKFCGTINWAESPFPLYEYTGTKVNKPDYNFKLGAPNTLSGLYYFTDTRTDQINAVTELIINPDYVEFDYYKSGWGLYAFGNVTKLTFTKPFKQIIIDATRYSLGLSKCKEIYGLDFGGSTIKTLWGFYIGLNITTEWDFLDTANYEPTRMDECFSSSNIDQVDFSKSNWDLSKCNNFSYCFSNCKSLTKIKGFNSNKTITTSFNGLFYNDANIESLEDCHFNSDSCTSLYRMFFTCSKLTNVGDLSNLTLDNANCVQTFYRCSSLNVPITLKGTISDANNMFAESSISSIDLTDITLNNANCNNMFNNCSSLTSPIVLKGSISNANSMFNGCSNLENVDLSNVDFSNCTNMNGMFGCKLNTDFEFTLTGKNLTNLATMSAMFSRRGLPKIKKVDLSNNTWRSEGVDCSQLFRWGDCETVDLRGIKCGSNLQFAFYQNTIDYLDIRGFDTANVTNMTLMTSIATEPYEIKIDSSFFNSNISVFPLAGWFRLSQRNGVLSRISREQEIAKLNMLFDALINHPKVNDDDWEEGQEIRLGANLNRTDIATGLLNPDSPYKDQTLIDKMNNAIDLGWTISFEE